MERKSLLQLLIDEGYLCLKESLRSTDLEEKLQERISMAIHEYGGELAEKEERWKDVINAYEISHYMCRNNYPEKIGDIYENKLGDYEHARSAYDGMQKPELRQARLSRKKHKIDEEVFLLCASVIRSLQEIQYKSILYLKDNNAINEQTGLIQNGRGGYYDETLALFQNIEELLIGLLDTNYIDMVTDKHISSLEHILLRFKERIGKIDEKIKELPF